MIPRFFRSISTWAAALGVLPLMTSQAWAQFKPQPTPFAIRFDATSLLAERMQTTLPLWLQGVSVRHYRADMEQLQITVIRLDLRKMKALAPFIELRIGLAPGQGRALVTAWSETGQQVFRSEPFGSATEPLTETLRVATEGADYVELELPRHGERLQSFFASAMRFAQVLQNVDFTTEPVADAFGNATNSQPASDQDRLLWNRVQALLDAGPFTLLSDKAEALEFDISRRPECAVVTFELRNGIVENPPLLRINETELPAASLTLPDLADPAWRARPVPGSSETSLCYSGWIRVQQFIPGEQFLKGINHLEFLQPASGESEEVRRVEIQLRYKR